MLVRIILTTVTYLLHISLEFVVNTTVSDDIILQWGWGQNSASFPIAFTKYSKALPVHSGTNGYVNAVISYDSDLTKIVTIFAGAQNDGAFHYIAVGA